MSRADIYIRSTSTRSLASPARSMVKMLVPPSRSFGTSSRQTMQANAFRQQARVMRMLKLKIQNRRPRPLRRSALDSARLQPRQQVPVARLDGNPRRRERQRLRPKLRPRSRVMLMEKVILRKSLLMRETWAANP